MYSCHADHLLQSKSTKWLSNHFLMVKISANSVMLWMNLICGSVGIWSKLISLNIQIYYHIIFICLYSVLSHIHICLLLVFLIYMTFWEHVLSLVISWWWWWWWWDIMQFWYLVCHTHCVVCWVMRLPRERKSVNVSLVQVSVWSKPDTWAVNSDDLSSSLGRLWILMPTSSTFTHFSPYSYK